MVAVPRAVGQPASSDGVLSGILNARSIGIRSDQSTHFILRGWVTFVNPATGIGFIQDRTGGMAFRVSEGVGGAPPLGKRVEMSGYVIRHQEMLMLSGSVVEEGKDPTAPRFEMMPEAPMPEMLTRQFDLTQASYMQVHAELTHFRAVVRHILPPLERGAPWRVEISSRTARGIALLPWTIAEDAIHRWKDHEVDVTGVLVCRASGEFLPINADAAIFVPSVEGWKVRPQAMDDVFGSPPQTAEALKDRLPRIAVEGRVHLRGIVTAVSPFHSVYLRTKDGSIQIETPQRTLFTPGDVISVACWPQLKGGALTLTDGICRRHERTADPKPVKIAHSPPDSGSQSGELVSIQGKVRDFFVSDRRYRVLLGIATGGTCSAYQSLKMGETVPDRLPLGTTVEVQGICQRAGEGQWGGDGATFAVMMRDQEDIRVVKAAPTVTREELIGLSWILAFVSGMIAVGMGLLKQKVRRQQKVIEEITRRTASTDERRRIASEFHDHLNQHLVSASLHLETIQDALVKKPGVVPELLEDAVKVLRQCREEARNVIWNLRLDEGGRDLSDLLRLWVEIRQKSSIVVKIEFKVEGQPFPITEEDGANIVRIAQEAVNNALTHASAKRVDLILKYGPDKSLALTIQDDGCGFSLVGPPAGDTGHYGLLILQERAARIRGRVDIRSEVKSGTRVRLIIPELRSGGSNDEEA